MDINNDAAAPEDDADLLYGVPAIAGFLKVRPRQAYHLVEKGGLPTFRLTSTVCARRSTLKAWLAAREAEALKGAA